MNLDAIQKAQATLRPYLRPTPLVFSEPLSRRIGREVWLKLENLQPTGSFKVRPAFFGILQGLEECRKTGVLTSSSGNFAAAVAFASSCLGVKATIVMRKDTAPFKVERTAAWGARIVFCDNSQAARFALTERLHQEEGGYLLHPFDSPETIAADGTIGLEIEDALGKEACVWVPVSGGGLVSGIAVALSHLRPTSRVFGLQSKANASFSRSLLQGQPTEVPAFSTFADALISTRPGSLAFSLAKDTVAGALLVEEASLYPAVSWLAEEAKIVVEPGAAVSIAALLEGHLPPSSLPLVCVLSGGNLPLQRSCLG